MYCLYYNIIIIAKSVQEDSVVRIYIQVILLKSLRYLYMVASQKTRMQWKQTELQKHPDPQQST